MRARLARWAREFNFWIANDDRIIFCLGNRALAEAHFEETR